LALTNLLQQLAYSLPPTVGFEIVEADMINKVYWRQCESSRCSRTLEKFSHLARTSFEHVRS